MFIKTISKTLIKVVAIIFFAQAAYAEITLKLGTTGRLGMPIGDAIDQALIPAMEKASGGKMKNWTSLPKKLMRRTKMWWTS